MSDKQEYVMVPREATPEMLATWSMFEHEGAAFAYRAMLQSAPPAPAPMADALLTIIRMAEKAKEPVFREDPESPAAIRNVKFSGIAQIAAQGLGWMQGPPLDSAPPAPVAHSKSEYKRRVAMGDANVLPPAVQPAPVFCEYCGGNDDDPPDHCMDCTRPGNTPVCSSCGGAGCQDCAPEASPSPAPVAAPVVTDAQIDALMRKADEYWEASTAARYRVRAELESVARAILAAQSGAGTQSTGE